MLVCDVSVLTLDKLILKEAAEETGKPLASSPLRIATRDICKQTSEIQDATQYAVEAIDQISRRITDVDHILGTIEEAVA